MLDNIRESLRTQSSEGYNSPCSLCDNAGVAYSVSRYAPWCSRPTCWHEVYSKEPTIDGLIG